MTDYNQLRPIISSITVLSNRATAHMELIQKLQRTSNYDSQIAELREEIKALQQEVSKLKRSDMDEKD